MYKISGLFVFVFCSLLASAQHSKIETIYLFPGQGSDSNIFNNLHLGANYKLINIQYPIPPKKCTMREFATMLLAQIDTTKTFAFIGVSLGGMLCTELADITHPKKVIVVASAKCRSELPLRYRFQKYFPINKIIPKTIIKIGAQILQPLVEPDRNKYKLVFKGMLHRKNKIFLKRSVNMIVNWDRKTYSKNIIHIHGTNDKTLPIRNIKVDYKIQNGSHMMMLTNGEELSKIIIIVL